MTEQDRPGIEKANEVVAKLLAALHQAGSLTPGELTDAEKQEYVQRVTGHLALTVATMPCTQHAMTIARPELSPQDRYALVLYHIVTCFGFDPEHEEAENYFTPPKNPLLN